jgi:SAM-dependent methyltransferase
MNYPPLIYDFVYESLPGSIYQTMTAQTLRLIDNHLPANPSRILEYGAATGRLALPLAVKGHRVTAIEPDQAMLGLLRTNAHAQGLTVDARQGTLQNDPVESECYDSVLCLFTVVSYLVTLNDLQAAMATLARVVKNDGVILFDVPSRAAFNNWPLVKTDILERRVRMIAHNEDPDLYDYHDTGSCLLDGKIQEYEARFPIRYWERAVVLEALRTNNIATEFIGQFQGSDHFVGRKKPVIQVN